MPAIDADAMAARVRPIFGALRSVPIAVHSTVFREVSPPVPPFITISRQVGAGALTLAQRLVERLNRDDPAEQPWTCWDRELVGKVASEHHLAETLVESLEDSTPSWLEEFFAGLASNAGQWPSRDRVFSRVAQTIRALAQAGRVVIVGRGGVHITHNMPGGIHVRLVATLDRRIAHMVDFQKTTPQKAAEHVRRSDNIRDAFHKRYWPNRSLAPETFHLTVNTGTVSEERAIDCILELVPLHVPLVAAP
jgi:cytidylate kinase